MDDTASDSDSIAVSQLVIDVGQGRGPAATDGGAAGGPAVVDVEAPTSAASRLQHKAPSTAWAKILAGVVAGQASRAAA